MKTSLRILLILVLIISCKSKKQKQFEKEIIGEWNYVEDIKVNHQKNEDNVEAFAEIFKNIGGYIFKKNGTVIDKVGIFHSENSNSREKKRTIYLGDSTHYKIDNDSLKIFNLENKTWNKFKIISITQDTLTIQKNNEFYIKYSKAHYKLNLKENYDKIIISSSGCYGTCPIMNIEFNKNGHVDYFGENYNLKNGFYISKISNSEYKSIENTFKKSDILKLNNSYSAPITDLNTISVTFVKNDRIIKTISDYGNQAPIEFIMAYKKAMYLYQKMKLFEQKKIEGLPNSLYFSIEKKNKQLILSQSELFLLLNEIKKGTKVSKKINPIYKLSFYNENDFETENIIYSDGRYYTSNKYIYDIGYNFIKQNQIESRKEPY